MNGAFGSDTCRDVDCDDWAAPGLCGRRRHHLLDRGGDREQAAVSAVLADKHQADRGVARALLYRMMDEARALGYRRFAFDTFPNRHGGMTVLGLAEGFTVTAAGYNAAYKDYRIRFEKAL